MDINFFKNFLINLGFNLENGSKITYFKIYDNYKIYIYINNYFIRFTCTGKYIVIDEKFK